MAHVHFGRPYFRLASSDWGNAGQRTESIKGPQDLLVPLHLKLAAPSGSELVVDQNAPELSRGLAGVADSLDEEVIRIWVPLAVEVKWRKRAGEGSNMGMLPCLNSSTCRRCAREGVGTGVGSIA